MLELINNVTTLREIQQELNFVYKKNASLSFYTPAYVLASFEHFLASDSHNCLFFVINRSQNEITHYFPWYIDDKHTLRFIFDKHTDYCSYIGPALDFTILKELTGLIINSSRIKRIDLDNLVSNDSLLNGFKHFLGLGTVISCYNNHSYINKTEFNKFHNHLNKEQIRRIVRLQKKNSDLLFEVFDGQKQFPKEQVIILRNQMIAQKLRETDFFDDSYVSFLESLYRIREIEIFSKWDNEQMICCTIVFKKENYRMLWIDLYSDIRFVSLSSYIDYIEYLNQFQDMTLSFARGSYDFKVTNFKPKIENLYNLRYSKSKFDFIFTNYYLLKYFLKRIIKK